jgi:regulator of PEP synthase PpsR (kinase-PPPase family)
LDSCLALNTLSTAGRHAIQNRSQTAIALRTAIQRLIARILRDINRCPQPSVHNGLARAETWPIRVPRAAMWMARGRLRPPCLRRRLKHGLLPSHPQRIPPELMPDTGYFHLHLVSDATGETLITVARAAAAQYANVSPVEHLYPMVRSKKQLEHVLAEIGESPGLVLYTLLEEDLIQALEKKCRQLGLPCMSVLGPILRLFQSYLGAETIHRAGAQHVLNAEYFQRIDALNYTMMHDDGQHPEGLEDADVVLIGVSRTSKTPTSIYLANRGIKTGNVPLVPGVPLAPQVEALKHPLVVGLYASPERIVQIRENRLLGLRAHREDDQYIDKAAVAEEVSFSRRLCARHNWPTIDVTRRSIEETAAAVMRLLSERRRAPMS